MIGADNKRQLWGWSLQPSVDQRHAVTHVVLLVQGISSTVTIKSFARRDGCEGVLLGPRIREFTERCVNSPEPITPPTAAPESTPVPVASEPATVDTAQIAAYQVVGGLDDWQTDCRPRRNDQPSVAGHLWFFSFK